MVLYGQTPSGTIALRAGQRYPIRLEYKRGSDKAQVRLMWSSASTPEEIVPHTRLRPNNPPLNR
jgi:hypothetical protein